MRVIGIDPGIKNLGVCCIDDGTVTFLETIDVTEFLRGIESLDPYLQAADVVAIESQPGTNRSVTKVMHFVELYVAMKSRATVVFIAPRTRLAFVRRHTTMDTGTYKERKLASVEVAAALMSTNDTLARKFTRLQKKDDVAEAFLCAWIATSSQHTDLKC